VDQELKLVGSHIARLILNLKDFMCPQAIEECYKTFKGIIRYVIPTSEMFLKSVTAEKN